MKITSSESLVARIKWYEQIAITYKNLSPEQLHELKKWDKEKKHGQDLTGWPGWQALIGKPPSFP